MAILPTGQTKKTKAIIWETLLPRRLTRHIAFDIFFGLVVISNAIFIGRSGAVLLRTPNFST